MKNYDDVHITKQRASAMIDETYCKGYDKACSDCEVTIEESYQRGLDNAWECARKVRHMLFADRTEIFGTESVTDIFNHYSASVAIAKIKEYEEKKKADEEIKVGDEVLVDERLMIVLGIAPTGWKQLWCPFTGLVHSNITTSEMTKTGRHFDIENMFD